MCVRLMRAHSFPHYPKPTLLFHVSLSCNNVCLSWDILMDYLRSTGSNLQVFLTNLGASATVFHCMMCDQKVPEKGMQNKLT